MLWYVWIAIGTAFVIAQGIATRDAQFPVADVALCIDEVR